MSVPQSSTTPPPLDQGSEVSTGQSDGRALGLVVIAAVQLLITLDATIVIVALPRIQEDLHFSTAGLSWVVTAYALPFGAFLLLAGRLGDIFGKRYMFIRAIAVFTAASLAAGFARDPAFLLAARAVQGASAAFAAANALALITATFREGKERRRALSIYTAMAAAGGAIGMLAGGVLTDLISWRWIFFVNIPIGIVVALLAPNSLSEAPRVTLRIDIIGAIVGGIGISLLVFGLSYSADTAWSDPLTVAALAGAIVFLTAFVMIEVRVRQPLMPLWILKDQVRAASYVIMLLLNASLFGAFFFLTEFFQDVLKYSPLLAGLAFLPASVGFVAGAAIVPRLIDRFSARVLAIAGTLTAAAGLAWLTQPSAGSSYVAGVLGPLILMSVGTGLTLVVLTITATEGISSTDGGLASGTLSTFRQVGISLGLALLPTIAITVAKDRLSGGPPHPSALAGSAAVLSGYHASFAVAAILAVVAAAAAVLLAAQGNRGTPGPG